MHTTRRGFVGGAVAAAAAGLSLRCQPAAVVRARAEPPKVEIYDKGRAVVARLWEPEKLSTNPLLIVELCSESFANPATSGFVFHSHALRLGHRILGMDVLQEGNGADSYGCWDIAGMNAALAAGRDIFGDWVRDNQAAIDKCVAEGRATRGIIIAAGISRAGFSAAHLMAADVRISVGAFFAPVTTLSALKEFSDNAAAEAITRLDLWNLAGQLAGRRIWMGIGHADTRVDTTSACRFYMALRQAENCTLSESKVDFFVSDDEDHTFGKDWYGRAAVTLLGKR